jgi:UrcA family protein
MAPSLTANRRCVAIVASLVGLALGHGLATAGTQAAVASRVVSYADLNLSNARDVATLYRRITRAADTVCDPVEALGHRECVASAVAEAIRQAHRPELSAYYEETRRSPWSSPTAAARR